MHDHIKIKSCIEIVLKLARIDTHIVFFNFYSKPPLVPLGYP